MSGTFTPSPARTIPYLGWFATPSLLIPPVPMIWPAKEPQSTLDYTVDLSAWLADANDTMVSVTVTPLTTTPGDVAIIPPLVVSGETITCWLVYGQGGASYGFGFSVATYLGRTADFEVSLAVQPDLPNGPAPISGPVPVSWQMQYGRLDYRTPLNGIYVPALT
jgi:hypothetical protein